MLCSAPFKKIMFLDIETTSQKEFFKELDERIQKAFIKRFKKDIETKLGINDIDSVINTEVFDTFMDEFYPQKAPIMPELGKIVCISVGYLIDDEHNPGDFKIRLKSFKNEDEVELLKEFSTTLSKYLSSSDVKNPDTYYFCGHNALNFDFRFICKRMLFNWMPIPTAFNNVDRKPWEISNLLDTQKIWNMGVFESTSVSLDLLSAGFEVESPKDDIDGSQVYYVYYKEKGLDRIAQYCEKDVLALARTYLAMNGSRSKINV